MRTFLLLISLIAVPAFAAEEKELSVPPPPQEPSAPVLTAEPSFTTQLILMQVRMLHFQKESMVGPVFTMGFGTAGIIGGLIFIALTGSYAAGIGVLISMISLLPASAGAAWLIGNLTHNSAINAEIDRLRRRRPLDEAAYGTVRVASF